MASSTVPAVAWMGPRYPSFTSNGISPQWSRWAWVSSMASSSAGSNANGTRLRIDSFGLPWNMPQSMRTRARSVTSRNCEPVTVVAPPRKWMSIARYGDRAPARARAAAIVACVTDAIDPTPFERIEREWADLHTAFETRLVDEHRGLPLDDDYPARRLAFESTLASFDDAGMSERGARRPRLHPRRARLAGRARAGRGPRCGRATPSPAAESPVVAALRRATYEAYGEATAAVEVGGETIDRLSAFSRLATADDAAERRAVFESMAPMWRAVDGDGGVTSPYPRLVAASAERWAREGSTIEANAAILGIAPGTFEPMLHAILALGRQVLADAAGLRPGARVEPWDYRYVVGEAERRLRSAIPLGRLRPINDTHLRSLGADPDELAIGYDIVPRRGRPIIPVAFTTGGRPGPWVFATYTEGGLGNLAELLHESGHALHYAAIRTRPAFMEPPADHAAFFEAIAELLGWDVHEPAFQARHLGVAVEPRAGGARSLRRRPARRLLGALRDRAPPRRRAAAQPRLGRGGRRRPGHRAAPGVVVVGRPRPAHRQPGLPRELRARGDRGGRPPGPDPRAPGRLVDR